MGDIWNAAHFDQFKGPFINEKNLRSLIPIIQCVGFSCVDVACSGGPVLNTRGEVVGMVVGERDEFQIALHVTTLKKLIECHENEAKGPTKVDEKSKEAKGPTKVDEKSKQPLDGGQGSNVS
jgi:chemotaxis signal transduction protein